MEAVEARLVFFKDDFPQDTWRIRDAGRQRRAVHVEFCPGLTLPCCTAEDLFVMKAFASRPKDWLDAESIVTRQGSLNRRYILDHLCALCELKETPEIVERAQRLLARKR